MLLEEFLQPAGISQAEFARRVGCTKARLVELIKGKRGSTADAALDLADVLGTSARLWTNLQVTYDLARAEKRRDAASAVQRWTRFRREHRGFRARRHYARIGVRATQ